MIRDDQRNDAPEGWEWVDDILVGPTRKLPASEIAYRRRGAPLRQQIAEQTTAAREALLAEYASGFIAPFPAMDPIEGALDEVAGRLVELPALGSSDWVNEAGHRYLAAGSELKGYYFIDGRADEMRRILDARDRYERLVGSELDESLDVIARIRGKATMRITPSKDAHIGLWLDVIAATIGGAAFVDASVVDEEGRSPFAGEDEVPELEQPTLSADASAAQVMRSLVHAVKCDDQEAWVSLFAEWSAVHHGKGRVSFFPYRYGPQDRLVGWEISKRLLLGEVYAIDVVDVIPVETLMDGTEFAGNRRVEQVQVEIDHIGEFGGVYRAFRRPDLNRHWTLQRCDGGPWRIASRQSL